MTQAEISDSVTVAASAEHTLRSVDDYFFEHAAVAGGPSVLPIRVDVGGLVVEHLVSATISSGRDYDEPNELALEWIPKHAGVYPSFRGKLHVFEEGTARCRIEIRGSYTPPFGSPGAVIDALLGRRVAHATLLELLGRFRDRAEASYRP